MSKLSFTEAGQINFILIPYQKIYMELYCTKQLAHMDVKQELCMGSTKQ